MAEYSKNNNLPRTSVKKEKGPGDEECDEIGETGQREELVCEGGLSGDEYKLEEKKRNRDRLSLEYKVKVVKLAKAHPEWNLKDLQRRGAYRSKNMCDLELWEKQINQGGTRHDQYHRIDSRTYDCFLEARSRNQRVTTKNLRQWALTAAKLYPNLRFKASYSWVTQFRRRHKIRQREVLNFVPAQETESIEEETLAAVEIFRIQTRYHRAWNRLLVPVDL